MMAIGLERGWGEGWMSRKVRQQQNALVMSGMSAVMVLKVPLMPRWTYSEERSSTSVWLPLVPTVNRWWRSGLSSAPLLSPEKGEMLRSQHSWKNCAE